jgi:hypothetical protein
VYPYKVDEQDGIATFQLVVWDLVNKTKKSIDIPPGLEILYFFGLTEHHAWVSGAPRSSGVKWLMKIQID